MPAAVVALQSNYSECVAVYGSLRAALKLTGCSSELRFQGWGCMEAG